MPGIEIGTPRRGSSCRLLHVLAGAAFVLGASPVLSQTTTRKIALRTFKVGNSTFLAKPKTICVIEGKWTDGSPFVYDAWDLCANMSVVRGSQAELKDEVSRGDDERFSGKDIPIGAEVIVISNEYSSVAVFRDRSGNQREILFRD